MEISFWRSFTTKFQDPEQTDPTLANASQSYTAFIASVTSRQINTFNTSVHGLTEPWDRQTNCIWSIETCEIAVTMSLNFYVFETYGTRALYGVKTNVLCASTIQRVSARERNEKNPGLITPDPHHTHGPVDSFPWPYIRIHFTRFVLSLIRFYHLRRYKLRSLWLMHQINPTDPLHFSKIFTYCVVQLVRFL